MAREEIEFEGLPWDVYAALAPLVDKEKGNQDELIQKFLAAWHKSPYCYFEVDTQEELDSKMADRDQAELRIIEYAKLWAAMQMGPADGETQHG